MNLWIKDSRCDCVYSLPAVLVFYLWLTGAKDISPFMSGSVRGADCDIMAVFVTIIRRLRRKIFKRCWKKSRNLKEFGLWRCKRKKKVSHEGLCCFSRLNPFQLTNAGQRLFNRFQVTEKTSESLEFWLSRFRLFGLWLSRCSTSSVLANQTCHKSSALSCLFLGSVT